MGYNFVIILDKMVEHRTPTSCLCPVNLLSGVTDGVRTSLCKMSRSLLPDDNMSAFHAKAPGITKQ